MGGLVPDARCGGCAGGAFAFWRPDSSTPSEYAFGEKDCEAASPSLGGLQLFDLRCICFRISYRAHLRTRDFSLTGMRLYRIQLPRARRRSKRNTHDFVVLCKILYMKVEKHICLASQLLRWKTLETSVNVGNLADGWGMNASAAFT